LIRRIAQWGRPIDASRPAFVLPSDLIPEGMAWDAAGRAFYVGSLLRHKIVRIGPDGVARDLGGRLLVPLAKLEPVVVRVVRLP